MAVRVGIVRPAPMQQDQNPRKDQEMKVVQLSEGKTALLRDPEQVPERLRRPIMLAASKNEVAAGATEEEIAAGVHLEDMVEMFDHMILALVSSWTLDVPVTLEALLDLPGKDYDALRNAATPHMKALMPDFSLSVDDESPTVPSGD